MIETRVRPPREIVLARTARLWAQRSSCARAVVGAVVTNASMEQMAIGYNGNARHLANRCDSDAPGACGCLHAEINALLKARGIAQNGKLFTTCAPCVQCAKASINAGITKVFFDEYYRNDDGLFTLLDVGVQVFRLIDTRAAIDSQLWKLDVTRELLVTRVS